MPERTSAECQLQRLLYILPLAIREGGATLDELARALGVEPGEVLRDLQEATARAFYHPAGTVDTFTIRIEGNHVAVWSPNEFLRPVRLTPHETLALGLGLRALASDAEPPRRTEILALAARLEKQLTVPDVEAEPTGVRERLEQLRVATRPLADVAPDAMLAAEPAQQDKVASYAIKLGDDGFRGEVADAVHNKRRCRIRYLKPGDEAPTERIIDPYLLIYSPAAWYVLARDPLHAEPVVFRMDRIIEATETEESFEWPLDFDPARHLGQGGRPFRPADTEHVVVRYSPRIAPWIAEKVASDREPDGSLVVRHEVADPRWVVRHVLQYAGQAELVEPLEMRELVCIAAGKMTAW